ncbi:hypothetical protein D9758_004108 [Tetrapyrgos nigripes]|uniref:Uncharacterized protein n=1 Tax=Tetrapyrgos nigripes TaxID=182062 RepID=A0A8H5LVR9_9AGAR|nr:hypothetical protein D9758_004108 [Tetrapyrgos nigripes]
MDVSLESTRNELHDALDEVNSPRVSSNAKSAVLTKLENLLAAASISKETAQFEHILALQYTFECNIPCRLLPWISACCPKLECLSGRVQSSDEEKHEASELSSQLLPALSVIQGIVLSHPPSKAFLGRARNIEILVDLLLASRHVASPSSTATTTKSAGQLIFLTAVVLDTLLCVLVDSCSALRIFEECNGVQAIVKILKRAGTPREVRMKCMEFLYFYLMDETTADLHSQQPLIEPTPPPTAPTTPYRASQTRKKKPFINNTPSRPISRYGSSTYAFSSSSAGITTGSGSSSEGSVGSGTFNPAEFNATSTTRSVSSSSATSFTSILSTSSNGTTSTAPSSASSSPKKYTPMPLPPPTTPPSSPPLQPAFEPRTPSQKQKPRLPVNVPRSQPRHAQAQVQARALMMLKKDVDFVPQSPNRPAHGHSREDSFAGDASLISRQGPGAGIRKHMRARSGLGLQEEEYRDGDGEPVKRAPQSNANAKTTEQKKQLLSTMLGNVDALVESVSKAGIWGLG